MGPKAVLTAVTAASAAIFLASAAQAAVTVLGSGLAHECSVAAREERADVAAIALCTQAIESEPLLARERAGTHINRGVMMLRLREFDAAIHDFGVAISYDPTIGEAYVNQGAALIGQRRYREGVQSIDQGLALSPEEPEKAWFNRALANERLDDMPAAYHDLQKALELKPGWEQPQKELMRFNPDRPAG